MLETQRADVEVVNRVSDILRVTQSNKVLFLFCTWKRVLYERVAPARSQPAGTATVSALLW